MRPHRRRSTSPEGSGRTTTRRSEWQARDTPLPWTVVMNAKSLAPTHTPRKRLNMIESYIVYTSLSHHGRLFLSPRDAYRYVLFHPGFVDFFVIGNLSSRGFLLSVFATWRRRHRHSPCPSLSSKRSGSLLLLFLLSPSSRSALRGSVCRGSTLFKVHPDLVCEWQPRRERG